jgi:ELWxxDGT repeat protein
LEPRTLFAARLVTDLVPGATGSDPTFLMNDNGFVVFSAINPQTNQRGLWRSDGTADGTVLLRAGLSPAKTNSATNFSPETAVRFGANNDKWKSLLFFAANDGVNGTEPWISDGTPAGTVLIQNINPNPAPNNGSNPDFRAVVNGTVYFAAAYDGVNRGLWRTVTAIDGTVTAERVPGVPPNLVLSSENFLTNVNGKVYFAADDGTTGDELWVFDPSTGQTSLVRDIRPPNTFGNLGSNPLELTNVNGTLYFTADDGSTPGGTELWKSDGTAAGTVRVQHFQAGVPDFVENLTYANGYLFFAASDGPNEDLMALDAHPGKGNAISKLATFTNTPTNLTAVASTLFFTANDGVNGQELWQAVPQAAGGFAVNLVRRTDGHVINQNSAGSFPQHLTAVVDTLFFSADDGVNGQELWRTVPVPGGSFAAELVRQTNGNDINPGPAGSDPADLVNVNGRLFFSADDGVNGRELWTFDNHQSAGKAFATVTANVPQEDATQGQDKNTQSETSLLVAGSTVLVGFNDSGALGTHFTGYARSTNGGLDFVDTAALPGAGDGGDSSLARDNTSGSIYFATLNQKFSRGNTIPVFRSTNSGDSFQAPINGVPGVAASDGLDKDWIAVDNFPGAGTGNVYLVVRHFITPPTPNEPGEIRLTRSTDGGATFSPNGGTEIVAAGAGNAQGAWVTVGTDHAVYVFWYQDDGGSGTVNPRIMMRKSTDQGVTFAAPVQVTTLSTAGVDGDLGLGGFDTDTFPQAVVNPVNGNIYVVYNDRGVKAGDRGDIFFRLSRDGGQTWSARVRVNDDTGTNDQWFPSLAVTPDGAHVGVFWYDRRLDDPGNTLIDRFGALGTVSNNGVIFGTNFAISNVPFEPVFGVDPGVNSPYMGDYDQAGADNSFFYTTWADNSTRNLAGTAFIADTRFQADVRFARIPVTDAPPAPPSTPPAPTGLTAAGGNGLVALSWNVSAGATSYHLFRGTTPGGEGSTVYQTITSTAFTDATVTNGTTYYYQVAGVNTVGEGLRSGEVSATPQVPAPPAPTGVVATPGNAKVALSWSPSAGAATYTVYRGTASGAETLVQAGVPGTSFLDAGLTNGQHYFYQVTASNPGGESPRSAEVSATPSAPPTLVGYHEFGVGAGVGGTAQAQFFNPDGTLRYSLNAFPGVAGGVRVASADFNGDGVADLVVGTGPGTPTQVEILDGVDKHVIFSINPFEPSFTGGVFVSAGDINGDGVPDLVISPDQGGGPRVRVFDGKTFAQIADFFGIDDPNFRGGARTAIGDINGDGKGDLIVAAGFGGGPRVAIFNGATLGPTGGPKLVGDFFMFEPTLRNGVYVAAGDLNGDGSADIIAGAGPGGGPRVYALSGKDLLAGNQVQLANFFAGDPTNRGGIPVAVRNLDKDTKADLVVGDGAGAGSHVTAYLGKNIPVDGTPPEAYEFDAFPGFTGGVFVG